MLQVELLELLLRRRTLIRMGRCSMSRGRARSPGRMRLSAV